MPKCTITVNDGPTGDAQVEIKFEPSLTKDTQLSAAQSLALEITNFLAAHNGCESVKPHGR